MKMPKELTNAILIYIGIFLCFLVMEFLGLSQFLFLRILNAAFIYYGVNRSLRMNIEEGQFGYITNLVSAGKAAVGGVFNSLDRLLVFIYLHGGTTYIRNLSGAFLFGGNPTANEYCTGILIERIASSVIIVHVTMQLWRKKTTSQDD